MKRFAANTARTPRTGAVCDIDPELFKNGCRIPLYPGQWNRWIVAASTEYGSLIGKPSEEERVTAIYKQVCQWFRIVENEHFYDSCDSTDVTVAMVVKENMAARWGEPVATWDQCIQPITVESPFNVYKVEFVYRGTRTSLPWPVWKEDVIGWSWCPVMADLAVMNVYPSSSLSSPVVDNTGTVIEKGRPVGAGDRPSKGIIDLVTPDTSKLKMPWGWIVVGVLGIVVVTRVVK